MNGWTIAKYVLALGGVGLVLAADRFGIRHLSWVGLGLIAVAFLLRFIQRMRQPEKTQAPSDHAD